MILKARGKINKTYIGININISHNLLAQMRTRFLLSDCPVLGSSHSIILTKWTRLTDKPNVGKHTRFVVIIALLYCRWCCRSYRHQWYGCYNRHAIVFRRSFSADSEKKKILHFLKTRTRSRHREREREREKYIGCPQRVRRISFVPQI